ncbi:cation:proton antiporter regulatory subunit [Halalkalicoccus sp. NIPERK01]|uniref:cation:proton antiporter regulatory subunit n=1 Tax=Halalkalicoccus sp. NIPERK01 TaxID=3053469 RepID=UPI00256F1006|nr:TrkA C-terminal domain-containing protein [Halalkalicoccus sp. NIPERK01]MDL5362701.1 TrkA C-terminal domain-containing protein [Halalkalicoccus sp. NIPERK01]
MDVSETDLPGVGKRFEVELEEGGVAVVVIHNSGRRELFYRESPDADGEELLDLTDRESRVVGSILEGAFFQPVRTQAPETTLGEGVILEWYTLERDSPVVGETLEESDIRRRTGATIIAVERGEEVFASPEADFTLRAGDVAVAVGTRENQTELENLLE